MQPLSGEYTFSIFVYGTLKRGFENHDAFCKGALQVEEAVVGGELYELPFGYPALVVRDATIRATGTANPARDIDAQHRLNTTAVALRQEPQEDSPRVFGELLTLDDPGVRLPKLDHLEGFVPAGHSLYRRVLIPAASATRNVLAWAYAIEKPVGVHLPGGRWPA